MIPTEFVRKAAEAIHREVWLTGRDSDTEALEDLPPWAQVRIEQQARAALESVAADIWDDAYNAGFKDSKTWDETGDTPNPYIQETR